MNKYRSNCSQIFLSILLFVAGSVSGHAMDQPDESGLNLFDPSPGTVIYLAQSTGDEEPIKEEVIEGEEEEEEPDCD